MIEMILGTLIYFLAAIACEYIAPELTGFHLFFVAMVMIGACGARKFLHDFMKAARGK